jgi:hypothetical protein
MESTNIFIKTLVILTIVLIKYSLGLDYSKIQVRILIIFFILKLLIIIIISNGVYLCQKLII